MQLPRGRHNLSREEVEQSQRSRMLLALASAMTEKGYVGTSVADVLKRAGVSRETFYQQFSSKLDCFMSAFDVAGEMLFGQLDQAANATEGAGTPLERFDHALEAYLDLLAEQPAFARVFLVEVYAAGPDALARRTALQDRIVDRTAELLGARTDEDRFACQMLVAATSSMITGPVIAQDGDALRGLRPKIVDFVRRLDMPNLAPAKAKAKPKSKAKRPITRS
jgi:AcrR family transcriptional regulator